MAPDLFGVCRDHGLRLALVGGRPGVAAAAGRVFHRSFGTRPLLTAPGYFEDRAQRRNLLRTLARRSPEVVICGMGSGLQDRFLRDLAGEGEGRLAGRLAPTRPVVVDDVEAAGGEPARQRPGPRVDGSHLPEPADEHERTPARALAVIGDAAPVVGADVHVSWPGRAGGARPRGRRGPG